MSWKDIRDGKCNGLFSIIEVLVNRISEEGLKGDELFMNMIEDRNLALGDNWAVSVCEYLAQYFESIPGEEKNKKAAEFIMEIAKQAGIELTEEQARSIAQAAYESLKNGGKDITEKGEEGDVKKEVIANA